MTTAGTYTIGKVVKRLQPSFPDLTVSKVRYLEAEGLVNPRRTKGGYRTFSEKDVERLATVLRLQKTCFYPLSVIKEKLEAADAGEALPELGAAAGDEIDERALTGVHALEDVQDLFGVPVSFARSLADAGLVALTRDERGKAAVDGADVPLLRTAHELKRYGLDPRFLRPYVQQANRELPIFKQVLSTVAGRPGTLEDARAREAFDERLSRLLSLTNSVRDTLVTRELRREFNYPKPAGE